jgi:hypothetical protein
MRATRPTSRDATAIEMLVVDEAHALDRVSASTGSTCRRDHGANGSTHSAGIGFSTFPSGRFQPTTRMSPRMPSV